MVEGNTRGLAPTHPDYEQTQRLETAILQKAKGFENFKVNFSALLRRAIDEVIDSARSNRFTLDEIEKTEKTYLGTKIEILLRNYLKMSKGKVLDLSIDGIEVDIKNTIGTNWTIPQEAVGHPCLLVKAHEEKATCSFGIVVITDALLNLGKNRDGKRTISKIGMESVHWLLRDEPYANFQSYPEIKEAHFMAGKVKTRMPADPDCMNDERAEWAGKVLEFFEFYGESPHFDATEDERREMALQNLTDLMTNFAHYCDRNGLEMQNVLRRSSGQYEEETEGEGTQFIALSAAIIH